MNNQITILRKSQLTESFFLHCCLLKEKCKIQPEKRGKKSPLIYIHLYEKKYCFLLASSDTFKLSVWISDFNKQSIFFPSHKKYQGGVCTHVHMHACVCVQVTYCFGLGGFRNKVQNSESLLSRKHQTLDSGLSWESLQCDLHCWPYLKVHRSFSPMFLLTQVSLVNYYLK